jgi:hypothetical protein
MAKYRARNYGQPVNNTLFDHLRQLDFFIAKLRYF